LDSQFHCSYLESRGVPGKTREIRVKKKKKSAGITGKKKREIIFLSFPVVGSRLPVPSFPVMPFPVMQLPVTSYPVMQLQVSTLLQLK
jgi:hypothetical protein